jgi:lambda repressor-like predicted transcriptional regulator
MSPLHIRAELLKRGLTLKKIADELGLSDRTVGTVVYGRGTSARVAIHISQRLNVPVAVLWPRRYPALESEERAA